MTKLTLALLEEIVAITREPTSEGVVRVKTLQDSSNEQIATVALAAALAIGDGRPLKADDYMLLLDLNDLN